MIIIDINIYTSSNDIKRIQQITFISNTRHWKKKNFLRYHVDIFCWWSNSHVIIWYLCWSHAFDTISFLCKIFGCFFYIPLLIMLVPWNTNYNNLYCYTKDVWSGGTFFSLCLNVYEHKSVMHTLTNMLKYNSYPSN